MDTDPSAGAAPSTPVAVADPTGRSGGDGFYRMERLSRGLVAVQGSGGGVYVGWRMYGFEYDASHPENVSYHLYRDGAQIADVTDSTNYRDVTGTLMQDPQYRMQVTSEQTAYNQPPHPGFHIGSGMAAPPAPNIRVR